MNRKEKHVFLVILGTLLSFASGADHIMIDSGMSPNSNTFVTIDGEEWHSTEDSGTSLPSTMGDVVEIASHSHDEANDAMPTAVFEHFPSFPEFPDEPHNAADILSDEFLISNEHQDDSGGATVSPALFNPLPESTTLSTGEQHSAHESSDTPTTHPIPSNATAPATANAPVQLSQKPSFNTTNSPNSTVIVI